MIASVLVVAPAIADEPLDLGDALSKKFLQIYPEYETVAEACPGDENPIHVGKRLNHDFDGDGYSEAIVLAYSCAAGTGGSDLVGVFTRAASGEVVELEIDDAAFDNAEFHENLRGKANLDISGGTLIREYPIYRDNDPNCCPSGGVRRFYYRWDGRRFVAERVEDSPPAEANQ